MIQDNLDDPPTRAWPLADQATELFARLLAREPVAPSDFAVAYLDPLVAYLRGKNPRVDEHVCRSAAIDTIMSVCKTPEQYNPAGRSIAGYLKMSAEGDLKNLLSAERRHQAKRENRDPVEVEDGDRNGRDDGDDPLSFDHPTLAPILATLTDAERCALELMKAGVRSNEVFAAELGLDRLPQAEREAQVLRIKDRVKRRLKRALEELP